MFSSKKKEEYKAPAPVIEEPVIVEPEPAPPVIKRAGTLIGKGIKFTGNIEASEDIEINGTVDGNIVSKNTVTVTTEGSIKGNVKAKEFILEGCQNGDSEITDFCKIGKEGKFFGNMKVSSLVTEDGSEFEGHLSLKKAAKAAEISFEEPEKEE